MWPIPTSSTSKSRRTTMRTPLQQDRKRIQDREAQRVSRERTKKLIEGQATQIVELRRALHEARPRTVEPGIFSDAYASQDPAQYSRSPSSTSALETHRAVSSPANVYMPNASDNIESASDLMMMRPPPFPWMLLPRKTPSTCPLDDILLKLLLERRAMLRDGIFEQTTLGEDVLNLKALTYPDEPCLVPPFMLIISDMVKRYRNLILFPTQVAVMWLFYRILRWMITPDQDNYNRLPDWARPLTCQLSIAHPLWMDFIPFPEIRGIMSQNHARYVQNDLLLPFVEDMSLNWPFELMDCVVIIPGMEDVLINPIFEKHVSRIENWTLGDGFGRAYPDLSGKYVKIRRENLASVTNAPGMYFFDGVKMTQIGRE